MFRTGDWVQALVDIVEVLPDGSMHFHALAGGVGHVWEVGDDWVNVTFERTGTTVVCQFTEVLFLGSATTGN